MNISEKEKKYLVVLGMVLVITLLYILGYKPLNTKEKELEAEVGALQTQLDHYIASLKPQIFYEEEIKKIKNEVEQIDIRLPQALPQELVIQTIDTMSKELELTLPTIGLNQVEEIALGMPAQNQVASEEGTSEEVNPKLKVLKGLKYSIATATLCSYEEFKALLGYVRQLPMEVALDNVSMTVGDEKLETSFSLSLFGLEVPERSEQFVALGEYEAGKGNLFKSDVEINTTINKKVYEDLFMIIDPVQSDNAAITMGSTKDPERKTYVYEESNQPSEVTIDFTQTGNKYYVRYNVGETSYPENGSKMILTPAEGMGIKIHSTPRIDENDKNAAHIKVNNHTDKPVYLYVKNDDEALPRFKLVQSVGDVRVK